MNLEDLITLPAMFSADRKYRYSLRRDIGGSGNPVLFIMLNPSTADETQDDPTIRRCKGFARQWDASTLYIANLFALRATDPEAMKAHPYPIGALNPEVLSCLAMHVGLYEHGKVVLAWGANGAHLSRGAKVASFLAGLCPLHHLGATQHGQPKHPLYLKANTQLVLWEA
jgi:hypothetical protein